ncbi:MAG: methyltransferase domain-containing protein, partial [Thiobacillaceae bacterium]|nr:methyltransferase domain-containing protein [Thiobacillaceae bacterium]
MANDPAHELFQRYWRQYEAGGAAAYQVPYAEVVHHRLERLPRCLERVPLQARILDVGCADGYMLYLLWQAGYRQLTGVDVSPEMVERARQRLPAQVPIIQADLRDYLRTVPDGSHDLILLHHVLEHIPREHTLEVLRHLHRLLAPGGLLNVRVPNACHLMAGYYLHGDFTHVVHYNERSLPQVLEAAGFERERIEPMQRPPRLYWSWRRPHRALLRL